jgi:hypothetical protein
MLGVSPSRAGQEPVQDVDRGLRRNGAGADRLGEVGDEERFASGACQRSHRRLQADAVAVRLDDGRAFRAARAVPQRSPVRGERVEIDREETTGRSCRIGIWASVRHPCVYVHVRLR